MGGIVLFIVGIIIVCMLFDSGKPLSDLKIDTDNASETIQLLSSINDNIHTIKRIVVFLFRLFGVALIISGIVMFFESIF